MVDSAAGDSRSASRALRASVRDQRHAAAAAGTVEAPAATDGGGCGVVQTLNGEGTVEIAAGEIGCEEAVAIFEQYADPATPLEGSGGAAQIGEWLCISSSPGEVGNGERLLSECATRGGASRIVAMAGGGA